MYFMNKPAVLKEAPDFLFFNRAPPGALDSDEHQVAVSLVVLAILWRRTAL